MCSTRAPEGRHILAGHVCRPSGAYHHAFYIPTTFVVGYGMSSLTGLK